MIIKDLISGVKPMPGSHQDRFSSEPVNNLTTVKAKVVEKQNASISLFTKDIIKKSKPKIKRSPIIKNDGFDA